MKDQIRLDWNGAHILAGEIVDALESNEAAEIGIDEIELIASVIFEKRGKVWARIPQEWLPILKE